MNSRVVPCEIWKTIPRFSGYYQASSLGRIRSVTRSFLNTLGRFRVFHGKILKPVKVGNGGEGYWAVTLCKSRKKSLLCKVHQLVLEAFVGFRPEGMECRHLDGNKNNNQLDNICWGTKEENDQDNVRLGVFSGTNNPRAKVSEDDVREIREMYDSGRYSQSKLGKMYGVGQDTISSIVRRETWSHIT